MENYREDEQKNETYQVLVGYITWNKDSTLPYRSKYSEKRGLPEQMPFDIPSSVVEQARRSKDRFEDTIESYVYNALTRKFGHEVLHCQIWLPEESV